MMKKQPFVALIFLLCPLLASSNEAGSPSEETLITAPGAELRVTVSEPQARAEAALDGGALRPVESTLRAPETGDHWLSLASRDRAGNRSEVRWIRLRVDAEPPTVHLRVEPEPFTDETGRRWVPPGASAVAEAHDELAGLSRLELEIAGRSTATESVSLTGVLPAAGGAVRPVARATDRVGHRAEAALDLQVDARGPDGDFVVHGPQVEGDPWILAPSSRVEARVHDDGSGVATWSPLIDGEARAPEALAGPWTAGEHAIHVDTVDQVGNEGRFGPLRAVVDAAGPEIRWRILDEGVTNDGGERVYKPPVTLEAEAADAPAGLAGLEASPDGRTFEPMGGTLVLDQESLELRATDLVGNVSTERPAWRLDREAPEILLRRDDAEEKPGRLEIAKGEVLYPVVRDAGAGIREVTCRFGRIYLLPVLDVRPQALPEVLEFPAYGEWRLVIEAVDRLGHASSAQWEIVVNKGGN